MTYALLESAKLLKQGPGWKSNVLCSADPADHQCFARGFVLALVTGLGPQVINTKPIGPVPFSNHHNWATPWEAKRLNNSPALHLLKLFSHLLPHKKRHSPKELVFEEGHPKYLSQTDNISLPMLTLFQCKYIMSINEEVFQLLKLIQWENRQLQRIQEFLLSRLLV